MGTIKKLLAVAALGTTLMLPALSAAAADSTTAAAAGAANVQPAGAHLITDGQTAAQFKLLLGDGQGVNADYLAKDTTRIQAAIISLRLQGKLAQAEAFKGGANFADAKVVNADNRRILAFLHANPQYGWIGKTGNRFDPLAKLSSQQFYKVLLETLGFKAGNDFNYTDTEAFAAGQGLNQIAGVPALTNSHLATALVEALSANTRSGQTLFEALQQNGVIAATASLPAGDRITLRTDAKLGRYLADGQGRTLYFFSNDAGNLDACQGQCLATWPFLDSDQLQIPAGLNPSDFALVTHASGTKQWMYKGWPLYRFVKDSKAGDVLGEGVNGIWTAAKPDYRLMLGANAQLGKYLTDNEGRTLYYLTQDMPQMSVCDGPCLVAWPAFDASGSLPSLLNAQDFGSITRTDGSKQATFKGYPLYYFINDKKHGDTTGQNVENVWFVVNPDTFTGGSPASSGMNSNSNAGGASMPTPPSQQPAPGQTAKTYTVNIKDFSFGAPLTVEAGSKITFTNLDDMEHSAVADNGSFATPLLASGESYTITLDKPGSYSYHCQVHPSMTGTITVQ
ncbi:hypothetical protein AWM70_14275 [Paenibacillus yonginensis]|uniref:EfeO-type cupredoxin-like domain-containing protein n=1 Tax=Paenibacillus yonginensis TaxID=1462996 RepID=A0A1B1N2F3_9BACL|nr:plastocyanin/azurin family copper-binding protein [Paenibacillus yonginensis]ANS75617.1 hypothetical protein AWM70_14275 [Paenibacillus yonginensis]